MSRSRSRLAQVEVLLNNGDGTFGSAIPSALPQGCDPPGPITAGDFNGDGTMDVAVGAECDLTGNGTAYCCGSIARLGDGSGGLAPAAGGTPCKPSGTPACYNDGGIYGSVTWLAAARLGGAAQDLLAIDGACGFDNGNIQVLAGHGDGSFAAGAPPGGSTYRLPGQRGRRRRRQRRRRQRRRDHRHRHVQRLLQQRRLRGYRLPGRQRAERARRSGLHRHRSRDAQAAGAVDLDGDGRRDVAVPECCTSGDQLQVFAGNGDGTFAPAQLFNGTGAGSVPQYTVSPDLNSDGRPDIAVVYPIDNFNPGSVTVYLNTTPYPGAATCAAGANLVCDPGFEDPPILAPYATYGAGGRFGPWVIGSGNVDVEAAGDVASAEGNQSLDLNGTGPGSVYQDVPTTAGTAYALQFRYAGNPTCGNETTHVTVTWGCDVGTLDFDTTGRTKAAPGWQQSQAFALPPATAATTRLQFTSGGPGRPAAR